MLVFFRDRKGVEAFLSQLPFLACPFCGANGAFNRHGYIRGYVSPTRRGIRAWRICCKEGRGGCGRAPSVRLASSLLRRCLPAPLLWLFIQALFRTRSVKAAWEQCHSPLSLDTGYRLFHRLRLCQPALRTALHSRAPPPAEVGAGSSLLQVYHHLQNTFGDACAVSAYQEVLQKDFLAIA